MAYEDVQVQRKASWDDGVDLIAWYYEERIKGKERRRMVAQCKRYQRSNLVGPSVVDTMVESLRSTEAGRGVIVTTSDFRPAATQRAREHRSIELVNGEPL